IIGNPAAVYVFCAESELGTHIGGDFSTAMYQNASGLLRCKPTQEGIQTVLVIDDIPADLNYQHLIHGSRDLVFPTIPPVRPRRDSRPVASPDCADHPAPHRSVPRSCAPGGNASP